MTHNTALLTAGQPPRPGSGLPTVTHRGRGKPGVSPNPQAPPSASCRSPRLDNGAGGRTPFPGCPPGAARRRRCPQQALRGAMPARSGLADTLSRGQAAARRQALPPHRRPSPPALPSPIPSPPRDLLSEVGHGNGVQRHLLVALHRHHPRRALAELPELPACRKPPAGRAHAQGGSAATCVATGGPRACGGGGGRRRGAGAAAALSVVFGHRGLCARRTTEGWRQRRSLCRLRVCGRQSRPGGRMSWVRVGACSTWRRSGSRGRNVRGV